MKDVFLLEIENVYDKFYPDKKIHYETLDNLANFFGREMQPHRHDVFYQIHYIESGIVHLQLGEKIYCEQAPLFFYTPPPFAHAFITNKNSQGHVVTIHKDFMEKFIKLSTKIADKELAQVAKCVLFNRNNQEIAYAQQQLLNSLEGLNKASGSSFADEEIWLSVVLEYLFYLMSNTMTPISDVSRDMKILQKYLHLTEIYYKSNMKLTLYSEKLNITTKKLNYICQNFTKKTAKRIIIERLLQESKYLLSNTSLTISEISDLLGFSESTYFSRFFRRETGYRPSNYRDSLKKTRTKKRLVRVFDVIDDEVF